MKITQSRLRSPLVLALLFVAFLSQATLAERRERLIDGWKPAHFDVSLAFNDSLADLTSVKTDVTVTILKKDVVMIDLDFGKMPVKAVAVDNGAAKFAQHDEKLDVYLSRPPNVGQAIKISIEYSGKPLDGLILVKDADGLPSAIGDNWPDRVHNWIPSFDHPSAKASVRFTVTAPSRNSVVANGILESKKENSDATTTWVWNEKSSISPYNMVVAAGQFATAELKTKAAVPISYYVTRSDRKFAEQGFSPAAPAVTLFSELIEPYPYEKLALVVGATKFRRHGKRQYDRLHSEPFQGFPHGTTAESPLRRTCRSGNRRGARDRPSMVR
jgi:aminopeptidase N